MIELHKGNNLKVMDDMVAKGVKVDLTVTSPPYDNLRTYEGELQWSEDIWKNTIEKLYEVTADGGVVVWVVGDATIDGDETGSSFKQALYFKEVGFKLHDTMLYQKSGVSGQSKTRYYNNFEYMFVFVKGKIKTFNPIEDRENKWRERWGKNRARRNADGSFGKEYESKKAPKYGMRMNIWKYKQGYGYGNDDIAYDHPAVFPHDLAKDHILSWSNEGDVVFDPFLGSGTTGLCAKETLRDFIGVELVDSYFELAKNRIENTCHREDLFDEDEYID